MYGLTSRMTPLTLGRSHPVFTEGPNQTIHDNLPA